MNSREMKEFNNFFHELGKTIILCTGSLCLFLGFCFAVIPEKGWILLIGIVFFVISLSIYFTPGKEDDYSFEDDKRKSAEAEPTN